MDKNACKTLRIEPAGTSDDALISGIIQEAYTIVAQRFDLTKENCPKHPSNCTPDWIKNDFLRGTAYYLLFCDGQAVGCAALEKADENTGYLERLAVLPRFQKQGIGQSLVSHIFKQAGELNLKTIGIGIIAKQHDLCTWYEKIGFIKGNIKLFEHLPFDVMFMSYML
ncbi:MAG: GNAT family N-acetyltransferase [Desulfobacteraceae bacterium]|nr:GNAT family N-acetyltransferase [Desulfobacteraceae bacterium]